MEFVKNILFDALVIIGLIAICLAVIWYMLELFNHIFNFAKYIVMYQIYKQNIKRYDLRNQVIVSKDGTVFSEGVNDLDEQIEILEKAIQNRKEMKNFYHEHMK